MGSHDSIFLEKEIKESEERAEQLKRLAKRTFDVRGYGNETEVEQLMWLLSNKDKIIRNRKLIDLIG